MFGVVPKVLWQDKTDVDERNRILLSTRTLVAVDRAEKRVILVDTGAGTKWQPDAANRFGICRDATALERALKAIDLTTRDVTDVVITHLHFDHNGGLTKWVDQPDGSVRLCFPHARHWVHQDHWNHAGQPAPKDRASFLPEDFAALEEADVLSFVHGDKPEGPYAGWDWCVSHGHTPAQLLPIFGTGSTRIMFAGDMIPTAVHIPCAWVMAYDLYPLTTIQEKTAILARCCDEGLLLAFPHDPTIAGVALEGTTRRPVISRELDLTVPTPQ